MTSRTTAWTTATLLLLYAASAAAQGTLEKRKEGTYFLEIGEVFLQSDEFEVAPALFDADGVSGPAPLSPLRVPTNDVFSTDPRVTMGLHRPGGKTTIAITAWEFNPHDQFSYETHPDSQQLVPTLGIPNLIFTRSIGINPLQDVFFSDNKGFKYLDISWERNIHEVKKHRTRLLLGIKYVQLEDRLDVNYRYADEFIRFGTSFVKFNDQQIIHSSMISERLGPKVGLESRFTLGKFRLTSRAELSMSEESIVVQYRNRAAEISPSLIVDPSGFRFGSTRVRSPLGVHDGDLAALDIRLFDTSEHRIVPVAEASIRGSWALSRTVEAGLEYRWLGLFDIPSTVKTAEAVRDTISPIDVDIVGVEQTPNDPDDDHVIYNFTVGDIVRRHDVVFQGLNFFLRFNF